MGSVLKNIMSGEEKKGERAVKKKLNLKRKHKGRCDHVIREVDYVITMVTNQICEVRPDGLINEHLFFGWNSCGTMVSSILAKFENFYGYVILKKV